MAVVDEVHQPRTQDGPEVYGKPTITSVLSAGQLESSQFLPEVVKTINIAFSASHLIMPELKMRPQGDRLGSSAELLDALRDDPEAFVIIISHLDSSHVIATATARRYFGPAKNNGSPWYRRSEVDPGTEEWELKLMATEPEAQGQGLARYMMRLIEQEIVRRFRAKIAVLDAVGAGERPERLKMVLCTPRELTGEFYERKGFIRDYETWRGEGYNFHVVHMSRPIELQRYA